MKVKLINISGNPIETIFRAYRTCYSKYEYDEIPVKSEEEMIDFIIDKINLGHLSPLEFVDVTFTVSGLSRSALAQLTRHRTSSFNVQSQRYIDGNNFGFVMPNIEYIGENERKDAELIINCLVNEAKFTYNELLKLGVKKEDARSILPMNTDCNLMVKMDLRNFRNFLEQRLCKHAQSEIRELATIMLREVTKEVPFIGYGVMRCSKGLCKECMKNEC